MKNNEKPWEMSIFRVGFGVSLFCMVCHGFSLFPKHSFSCYLNIRGGGLRKVDELPTSPNNQFRGYFIRNRIEELVPLNWNFASQTLKTEQQIDQTVFKP